MVAIIKGEAANYTPDTSYKLGSSEQHENVGVGATDTEPYTTNFGPVIIRASSLEEINNFLAWLSNMAGKPTDQLSLQDLLQTVKVSDFGGYFQGIDQTTGQIFSSFSLSASSWKTIDAFNDTHFFGDRIPKFPAGSGAIFGTVLNPANRGLELDAGLTGFEATAQLVYQSNYPENVKLPGLDHSALNPDVLKLLQHLFGTNTTLDQGHLNVLKMMNMVNGKVNEGAGEWRLSADTGVPLLKAYEENPQVFVPSISLLELEQVDFTKAKGVPLYFDKQGNFINGNGPENVEKIAGELIEKMSPANTPLPAGTELGEKVANALNSLFGLPLSNSKFTAEQVNTAVAIGLVTYDPIKYTVNLTNIGQGYITTKDSVASPSEENASPATPEAFLPQTTIEEYRSKFNDQKFVPSSTDSTGANRLWRFVYDPPTSGRMVQSFFDRSTMKELNAICQSIFGKSFDDMSISERLRALHILSTSDRPLMVLSKTSSLQSIRASSFKTYNINAAYVTSEGRAYLQSLNQA